MKDNRRYYGKIFFKDSFITMDIIKMLIEKQPLKKAYAQR